MTRRALALSPHLDDAVFSCGGTLAMLARQGWHVTIATLFTQSVKNPQGFALACQTDKGLGPEIDYMALRRNEDVAACHALGIAAPIHVPLPEAPHRGYHSAAALFDTPLVDDFVLGPLRSEIEALLRDEAPDLVLAPQAIGEHVDHVQLVVTLGAATDRNIAFWRDFPYAIRTDVPHPFAAKMQTRSERAIQLDETDLARREAACLAYASQLGFQFGGSDRLRARLRDAGPVEWLRSDTPIVGAP